MLMFCPSISMEMIYIYIAEELLCAGILPKVVIIEYNAKFPPPILFQIDYEEDFVWRRDDYFGASLQSMQNCFNNYGYTLIACNSGTGSNCFWIFLKRLNRYMCLQNISYIAILVILHQPKLFCQYWDWTNSDSKIRQLL